MSNNHNHPPRGSRITVDPIRDSKDIETIKRLLRDRPRDLLLFVMGIKNGLRGGDLLKRKAGQVRHLKTGQGFSIRAFHLHVSTLPRSSKAYLFDFFDNGSHIAF